MTFKELFDPNDINDLIIRMQDNEDYFREKYEENILDY